MAAFLNLAANSGNLAIAPRAARLVRRELPVGNAPQSPPFGRIWRNPETGRSFTQVGATAYGTFLPFRGDVSNGRSRQEPTSSTGLTGYQRATEAGPI